MRMTGDHLPCQGVTDISHIKLRLLLSDLRIETDMEQHITQLLADIGYVVLDQSIAEFIGLFDGIGTKALVGLFLVPRTICPQCIQDIEKSTKSLHFFLFCVHKSLINVAKIQNN